MLRSVKIVKVGEIMNNYQVLAWNGKRYQSIAGIDRQGKPSFVGNRIYGIVLWMFGQSDVDAWIRNAQEKYPHINFKLAKVR